MNRPECAWPQSLVDIIVLLQAIRLVAARYGVL